jgi:hypothetical protein
LSRELFTAIAANFLIEIQMESLMDVAIESNNAAGEASVSGERPACLNGV